MPYFKDIIKNDAFKEGYELAVKLDKEVRCIKCNKLLYKKLEYGKDNIEIKCKCGTINNN